MTESLRQHGRNNDRYCICNEELEFVCNQIVFRVLYHWMSSLDKSHQEQDNRLDASLYVRSSCPDSNHIKFKLKRRMAS